MLSSSLLHVHGPSVAEKKRSRKRNSSARSITRYGPISASSEARRKGADGCGCQKIVQASLRGQEFKKLLARSKTRSSFAVAHPAYRYQSFFSSGTSAVTNGFVSALRYIGVQKRRLRVLARGPVSSVVRRIITR